MAPGVPIASATASLDADRRLRLERVLALARLGLALVGTLIAQAGPQLAGPDYTLASRVLPAYTFFALAAAVLVALLPHHITPLAVVLHLLDIAWVLAITPLTDRSATIFFVVAVFAVIGAAFRWGLKATVLTGVAIASLMLLGALVVPPLMGAAGLPELDRLGLRAAYVAGVAYLIGALAEEQHQARLQASTAARVLGTLKLAGGLRASVRPLLAELAAAFGASHAALAVQEVSSGRAYLWAPSGTEVTVMPLDERHRAAWWVALPGRSSVKLVERTSTGARVRTASAIRHLGAEDASAVTTVLDGAGRALVGEWHISREWAGRLFLFDPARSGERHRKWLATLLPQAGAALYSLYLLARLRSRATAMERARVARELHDGVIQTLVGLEMHVETMRRELERAGSPLSSEMEAIRQTLRASALNTRDLMQELKPLDVSAGDLPGQLASAADRFRRDTSIVTTFVCDLNDVQIAPRTGREILRIAQEALVNVRKHSGARNVVLRFGADDDRWRLTVDDDGRGFEFAGRHTLDELDAARRGPVVIKERVRGLGGTLTIDSMPGRGTRVEVDVPRSVR
jgi:signal transduction histidine kinase